MSLKQRLTDDMKAAMRSKDKDRLTTIRLVQAAIKQIEVDTRKELDDVAVLAVLDKMVKQRRESIKMFDEAGRDDLSAIEKQEMAVIEQYLPEPMTDDEIESLIQEALQQTGASTIRDMGKVMAFVKPKAQGRADMGKISGLIKAQLG
jgi:uncharacterized protein YqeY